MSLEFVFWSLEFKQWDLLDAPFSRFGQDLDSQPQTGRSKIENAPSFYIKEHPKIVF